MRRLALLLAISTMAVGIFGVVPASAKTNPPVTLTGKVNVHGKKDVSSSSKATIELEQDDYYFEPTFIKVRPGETVTLEIKNEGDNEHTFTSTTLKANKTLSPDSSKKITVTIPKTGTVFQFHCEFHESMGMQGAFYLGSARAIPSTSGT